VTAIRPSSPIGDRKADKFTRTEKIYELPYKKVQRRGTGRRTPNTGPQTLRGRARATAQIAVYPSAILEQGKASGGGQKKEPKNRCREGRKWCASPRRGDPKKASKVVKSERKRDRRTKTK